MADETEEARKKELEYLEQMRKGAAENSKQYELLNGIIEKVKKQTVDYSSRLVELSKKSKDERDASDVRKKVIKEEIESIKSTYKTKADQEAELAIRQAKNLSQLEGAQRELLAKEYQQVAALVKTEERQKVFNDSLASTKSYLLPLGQAAGDVAKSLASSIKGNPLEASAAMATKYAEKAGQGLNAAGTAAGGLGQELMKGGTTSKIFGGLLQAGGLAAQGLGTAANVAAQAMATIAPIMAGFVDTFKKANGAGATFGGGMTELRNLSGYLGTTMENLVGGIEKGQDAFQRAGLNFQQATRVVSQFGKGLVKGDEANQLFALGFTDVSDRIALSAQAFDQLRVRGLSEAEAKAKLTETTLQYGKDLKVLQGIAGKNAEKELEKGRIESQRASIMTKLDGDQRETFAKAMSAASALPGDLAQQAQKALMQKIAGGAVTDPAVAGNEAIMGMVNRFNDIVMKGGSPADLQQAMADAAQQARENAPRYAAADKAAVMGVEGIAKSISDAQNSMSLYKATIDQGRQTQDDVNKATDPKSMDPTVKKFAELTTTAGELQSKLQMVATSNGAIDIFATAMGKANEATQSLITMVNSATSGKTGSIMESGAKGLMDVISSPNTWMTAAGVIGAEIALKMGTSLLSRFPALSGVLGAGATAAGSAIGAGAAATGAGVAGTTAATAATTAATAGAAGAAAMTGAAVAGVAIAAAGAIVGSAALADYIEEKSGLKEAYQKRMATEEYKNMSQDQAGLAAGVGARLSGRSKATGNPADIAAERTAYINDRQSKKIPTSMTFDEWKANKDKAPSVATPVNPGASITPTPTAESVFGPEGLQPLNQQQRAAAGVDESGNRVVSTTAEAGKEQLDATRKQIALWEDIHDTLLDLVRYSRTTAEAIQ